MFDNTNIAMVKMRIAASLGMFANVFSKEKRMKAVQFMCQVDKGIQLLRYDCKILY